MEPELTKDGAKIEKSALNRPKWLPDGSQDHFPHCPPPHFHHFWVLSGTPKSTKNRSFAPKGGPGSDYLPICFAESVFLYFGLEFSSILGVKSMEKIDACFQSCAHFFNLARPQNHAQAHGFENFSRFLIAFEWVFESYIIIRLV